MAWISRFVTLKMCVIASWERQRRRPETKWIACVEKDEGGTSSCDVESWRAISILDMRVLLTIYMPPLEAKKALFARFGNLWADVKKGASQLPKWVSLPEEISHCGNYARLARWLCSSVGVGSRPCTNF